MKVVSLKGFIRQEEIQESIRTKKASKVCPITPEAFIHNWYEHC